MKRSKYGNKKTCVNGRFFDSLKEARRYEELLWLEKAGEVRDISCQVKFSLAPAVVLDGRKKPELRYFADFVYFDTQKNEWTTEDVKGHKTDVYRIKRHLMATVHGIIVSEV